MLASVELIDPNRPSTIPLGLYSTTGGGGNSASQDGRRRPFNFNFDHYWLFISVQDLAVQDRSRLRIKIIWTRGATN